MYQVVEGICQFRIVILNKTTLFGWRPEVCTYHEEAEWSAKQASARCEKY
jgi:hypothetical protein